MVVRGSYYLVSPSPTKFELGFTDLYWVLLDFSELQ